MPTTSAIELGGGNVRVDNTPQQVAGEMPREQEISLASWLILAKLHRSQ